MVEGWRRHCSVAVRGCRWNGACAREDGRSSPCCVLLRQCGDGTIGLPSSPRGSSGRSNGRENGSSPSFVPMAPEFFRAQRCRYTASWPRCGCPEIQAHGASSTWTETPPTMPLSTSRGSDFILRRSSSRLRACVVHWPCTGARVHTRNRSSRETVGRRADTASPSSTAAGSGTGQVYSGTTK